MERDAPGVCGARHKRSRRRAAYRWGKTKGKIGFHGGMVEDARPRLRGFDIEDLALRGREEALTEDCLGKWTMIRMRINVSTRKIQQSLRPREGDVPAKKGLAFRNQPPPGILSRCRWGG